MNKLFNSKNSIMGPALAVVVLMIILSFTTNYRFLTVPNLTNILRQTSINALVSFGMLFVLLTGGIDLTVGSVVGFATCIMAVMFKSGIANSAVLIISALLIGILVGAFNGILFTKLHLPHPFVSTLGMMGILRGLVLIISNSLPVNNFPAAINFLGANNIAGNIPVSFILVVIAVIICTIFLTKTALGRKIYVVGGNLEAARLSGINVDNVRIFVYAFAGFMSALAGIVLIGRVNAFFPTAGESYEMDAIAACVIGGASFLGGKGTAIGTIVGALFMSVVNNGLNLMGASSDIQRVVVGVVIILAVFLDVNRTRLSEKSKLAAMEKVANSQR